MKLVSIVIPIKKINNESVLCWGQTRKSKDNLNGFFEFPGGKIEGHESPLLAAIREVKEETGVILAEKDISLAFIWNDFLGVDLPIRFYVYLTSCDFSLAEGKYLRLEDLCQQDFKIPPINKVFLNKYKDKLSLI